MRTGRKARYPVFFFKYVLPRDVTQGNCMTFNLSISSIRQFSINIILKYEKWEKERARGLIDMRGTPISRGGLLTGVFLVVRDEVLRNLRKTVESPSIMFSYKEKNRKFN